LKNQILKLSSDSNKEISSLKTGMKKIDQKKASLSDLIHKFYNQYDEIRESLGFASRSKAKSIYEISKTKSLLNTITIPHNSKMKKNTDAMLRKSIKISHCNEFSSISSGLSLIPEKENNQSVIEKSENDLTGVTSAKRDIISQENKIRQEIDLLKKFQMKKSQKSRDMSNLN